MPPVVAELMNGRIVDAGLDAGFSHTANKRLAIHPGRQQHRVEVVCRPRLIGRLIKGDIQGRMGEGIVVSGGDLPAARVVLF